MSCPICWYSFYRDTVLSFCLLRLSFSSWRLPLDAAVCFLPVLLIVHLVVRACWKYISKCKRDWLRDQKREPSYDSWTPACLIQKLPPVSNITVMSSWSHLMVAFAVKSCIVWCQKQNKTKKTITASVGMGQLRTQQHVRSCAVSVAALSLSLNADNAWKCTSMGFPKKMLSSLCCHSAANASSDNGSCMPDPSDKLRTADVVYLGVVQWAHSSNFVLLKLETRVSHACTDDCHHRRMRVFLQDNVVHCCGHLVSPHD